MFDKFYAQNHVYRRCGQNCRFHISVIMLNCDIGDFDLICGKHDFEHKIYQKLIKNGIFMAKIVIRIFYINKIFQLY